MNEPRRRERGFRRDSEVRKAEAEAHREEMKAEAESCREEANKMLILTSCLLVTSTYFISFIL